MAVLSINLPDVGEGVTEAELAEWHVDVGDLVREDEIIAAVMTDKATVEIPSLYDGKVVARAGEVGDVVAIGTALVEIETEAHGSEERKPETALAEPPRPLAPPSPAPRPHVEKAASPVLAAPSTRRRARQEGVDLARVAGSGPAGRITPADLDSFLVGGSTAAHSTGAFTRHGVEEIKVVGLRRKIAERMAQANSRIPHITVIEEVDVTALEDLRAKLNETRGEKPKLTVLPLISAALVKALGQHPEMNAHFDDEAGVIRRHGPVHVGMATMTDNGLVVPVIRHAEALRPFETAAEILRLSGAARAGSARREDLQGSTITITSLGRLGAIATTPIINPPEVAILGVNKMEIRPHWDGNQFVPRQKMNLSASFDHRVIDGWDAAVFVQKMKSLLETPALIFVDV